KIVTQMTYRRARQIFFLIGVLLVSAGCGEKKVSTVSIPPPPPITAPPAAQNPSASRPDSKKTDHAQKTETSPSAETTSTISVPENAKPLLTETGLASWYGPPYHNRRASNGEIYDMNAMTAAHRTLPLGSIVRVTNLKTGHSALVRITDRGPFINGRI